MEKIESQKRAFNNVYGNSKLSNAIQIKGLELLKLVYDNAKKASEAIEAFELYIDGIITSFRNLNRAIYLPFLETLRTQFALTANAM